MFFRLLTATLAAMVISVPSAADEISVDSELLELLGSSPTEQAIQNAYQQNPDKALELLTVLLNNEVVDPQVAITEALNIAPEKVTDIVDIARSASVSNEIITTAALLAGLDPTVVAEATAAGIQTASATSSIAPPSTPAVGANGGGGNAVVSPN